jgi:hypothetical protein
MKVLLTSLFAVLAARTCLAANSNPPRMASKLIELAGASSQDCGSIPIVESPDAAIACTNQAMQAHAAFRLAIQYRGIDSDIWEGAAGDDHGHLWVLWFDSAPGGGPGGNPFLKVSVCHQVLFLPMPDLRASPRDRITCETPPQA